MKQKLKFITCMGLIVCLSLGQFTTVFAGQSNDKPTIFVKEEGKKIIRSAEIAPYGDGNASYDTDKDAKDKVKASKDLLMNLGYTEFEINTIGDDKIYDKMKDATSISVVEEYLMVDSNGNTYAVDKETCLKESYKINHPDETISSYSNYAYNSDYSPDGYMKISTESIYMNSGYYMFTSTFTWLTMPTFRMIDAMSLAAPNVAFTTDGKYSSYNYLYKWLATGLVSTESGNGSVITTSTGLYSKFDLMDNLYATGQITEVLGMTFVVSARARVSAYTAPLAFNVYSKYEHVYSSLNIQPSFSWTTTGVSADIGVSLVNNKTSYYGSNFTNYTP